MENKLYEIGIKGSETKTANATIAGYVRDDQDPRTIARSFDLS